MWEPSEAAEPCVSAKTTVRLAEKDDVFPVIHVNGATITDNYWIRPISRGYPSKPKAGDMLICLFNELLDEHPEYRKYIPELTEDTVRKTIAKIGMRVKTQTVVDLVMGRYGLIRK